MTIKIRKNLVSESKYGIKCPYKMDAETITVHNTYNDAPAENEVAYMIRNSSQVSYHYAVDDKEAVQGILTNRNAWHAGDGGNGKGNRSSIGVEICYSKSGGERYKKAEANAVILIAQLLKERGWGVDKVRKHQDWSGKYCPHRILDEKRWDDFEQAIADELKGNKPKPVTKPVETKVGSVSSKPNVKAGDMKTNSIVDYLKSIGESSSFSNRSKLAKQYGISGYAGTASQNIDLLEAMRKQAPKKAAASKPKTKGDMKTNSLVDYLKSIGVNSSFANRKKLAAKYGIKNYTGTASQNTELLDKLRR
jgi:N-acetylmuramoyl-L-alanine amidase CwlA